ncbi:mitochondrial carrier domain-containing protein [Globomyces pollinis-pini]|nr:mitochondrial carrier domain-containing protein [Globomyces pollinis-pini]
MQYNNREHAKGFAAGALAACGAVTFTNPWEVVKTRLQLQGELQAKTAVGVNKPYGSAITTFGKIFMNEGVTGLQRGLMPAYIYQVFLNGFRLGSYEPLKNYIQFHIVDPIAGAPNSSPLIAMVSSGALAGVMGAAIASPFFLIKTRMQAYTKGSAISVGHQHTYVEKGTFHSLKFIFQQDGLRGLWRGADASMLRTGVGSSVQLPSYDIIKNYLFKTGYFDKYGGTKSVQLHFAASLGTSLLVCTAMNPFDVAMTRMYNQKDGNTYKNVADCIAKTLRYEGITAFFKGYSAHYLRIGPHTILTFMFLEQTKRFVEKVDSTLFA